MPGAVRIPVPPRVSAAAQSSCRPIRSTRSARSGRESRDAVLVLAGFALLSAVLIYAVIGRALRPLENLSSAFEQIGKGDYHGRLPERGPPELTRLASGFNLMTQRLATIAAQNRRLNERLLTLQAEERADLARDLHDEIGPLLFAVDMTAATIERLCRRRPSGRHSDPCALNSRCGRSGAASCAGHTRTAAADPRDRAGGRDRPAGGILAKPPSRHRRSRSMSRSMRIGSATI